MMLFICPADRQLLREVQCVNLYSRHWICPRCRAVYVSLGFTLDLCKTPALHVVEVNELPGVPESWPRGIEAGPACRGLI